jgi:hypothetical protein
MDDETLFGELLVQATADADRFGHRQHLHLTWLAVRRLGAERAATTVSEGIRRTARYAGAPQKYSETTSRAWVALVAHHVAEHPEIATFDAFAARFPRLLDKRLLSAHYRSSTLAADRARREWVEPDLLPFPWHHPS